MNIELKINITDKELAEQLKQFFTQPKDNLYRTDSWKVIRANTKGNKDEEVSTSKQSAVRPVVDSGPPVVKHDKASLQALIDSVPAKPVAIPGNNGHFKNSAYFSMRAKFSNDILAKHIQDWTDDFPEKNISQVIDECVFECLDHPEVEVKNYKDFVKSHLKG